MWMISHKIVNFMTSFYITFPANATQELLKQFYFKTNIRKTRKSGCYPLTKHIKALCNYIYYCVSAESAKSTFNEPFYTRTKTMAFRKRKELPVPQQLPHARSTFFLSELGSERTKNERRIVCSLHSITSIIYIAYCPIDRFKSVMSSIFVLRTYEILHN